MSEARLAGLFYLLTFATGIAALFLRGAAGAAAGTIAGLSYIAVTILFYRIFRPVHQTISLIAAIVSLAGCAAGVLATARLIPASIHPLVFFGVYCLLIGWLIDRSAFLPKFLGVLMAFAGLGWLTFLSPSLARSLSPYIMAPGMIGEGALTVWLLVVGVKH